MLEDSIKLKGIISKCRDHLENYLAYIKTFSKNEFADIYCEREWRSIKPFNFYYSDVAFIILPRKENINYFAEFIDKQVDILKIPKEVAIIAWEDLFEY